MFPEALMLHYLDDLDSKMESMRTQFLRDPDTDWTPYNHSLERPLLNSKKYLEKIQAPPAPVAAGEEPKTTEPQTSERQTAEPQTTIQAESNGNGSPVAASSTASLDTTKSPVTSTTTDALAKS
jgi:3'-5' exoribonuclease